MITGSLYYLLMSEVTRILSPIEDGSMATADQLLPQVYDELRRLAVEMLATEQPGQTLQATALVNEAWLRLAGTAKQNNYNNREHFFAVAAEAMRRILVDQARRKATLKRGGELSRAELLDSNIASAAPPAEFIAVHEALDALAANDALTADLIKLHYFGGFSLEEVGELLGMSRATAYRLWIYGRAWLRAELIDATTPPESRHF